MSLPVLKTVAVNTYGQEMKVDTKVALAGYALKVRLRKPNTARTVITVAAALTVVETTKIRWIVPNTEPWDAKGIWKVVPEIALAPNELHEGVPSAKLAVVDRFDQ